MPRTPLNYSSSPTTEQGWSVWDVLEGWSLFAPFLTIPLFIVGQAFMQDYLINGDGRSHERAALLMAVPIVPVTILALAGAVHAFRACGKGRKLAAFALIANALTLGLISWALVP